MEINKGLESLLLALTDKLSDEDLLLSHLQSDIAATIAEKRTSAGLSQKALAEALSVSQGLVSRWESGDCNFTLRTLVQIAQKLSINMQSPYVMDKPPHYHSIENVVEFPIWAARGYTQPGAYTETEELEEM